MNIRLHEIELGVKNCDESHRFYSDILSLKTTLIEQGLKVFDSGNPKLDFNVSTHLMPGGKIVSFITDDLSEVMKKLQSENIKFDGPKESHLGMLSVLFSDPDGNLIRINEAGPTSPSWVSV